MFERPNVHSSNVILWRTQSHVLAIAGEGFTRVLGKTQVTFNPPLIEDTDYTINVIDRTSMEVTLLDRKAWRPTYGPLQITQINTRGDETGWVKVGGVGGVHVAEIADDDDVDSEATGTSHKINMKS